MTIIVECANARNPVHVLIIGVGAYDGNLLSELPGVVRSAEKAAKFWSGPTPCSALGDVGSVEVLLSSSSEQISLTGSNGESIEGATCYNVRAAFDRWVMRCAKNKRSRAVLHWIGHGTDEFGQTGTEEGRILFCQDYDAKYKRQHALSLSMTTSLMRRIKISEKILLFIDTCRDKIRAAPRPAYPPALDMGRYPNVSTDNRLICYGLTHPGDKAVSHPNPEPVCSFDGGTLITEATLDAIRLFGAERNGLGDPWFSKTNTLVHAVNQRLEWWHQQVGHSPKLTISKSQMEEWAISEVKAPSAMISIEVDGPAVAASFPSDIEMRPEPHPNFSPDASSVGGVVTRQASPTNWRGELSPGWWRSHLPGTDKSRRLLSLPPRCNETWGF